MELPGAHLAVVDQDKRQRIHQKAESTTMKEHERVVLTTPVVAEGLEAGDVGTVVHVYGDGKAYEVEFLTLDGRTAAVVTLEAVQVRPVGRREITHARELAVAWP